MPRSVEVRRYDLLSRERFGREQVRRLTQVSEHILRVLAAEWTAMLRVPVRLRLEGVSQLPVGDAWESRLPKVAALVYVSVHPLPGALVAALDPEIAAAMVDRAAGGPLPVVPRPIGMTETEDALLRHLAVALCAGVRDAMRRYLEVQPQVTRVELLLETVVPPGSPGDPCLVAELTVRIGDGYARTCFLVWTYALAEAVLARVQGSDAGWPAGAGAAVDRMEAARRLKLHLLRVPVTVRVEAGGRRAALGELRSLRPGDVVLVGGTVSGHSHLCAPGVVIGKVSIAHDPDTRRLVAIIHSLQYSPREAQGEGSVTMGHPEADLTPLERVELTLTVEVGRTTVPLGELLSWQEGAIIELDRMAGDPVVLLVNGVPVARGELVQQDDQLAVRILEVLDA